VTYHGAVKKEGNVPLRLLLGRLHSGRPYLSLPCFSCTGEERAKIGTEKRKREKKGKRNREKEERSKIGIERREPREEKEKKKRERKKKNRRKKKKKTERDRKNRGRTGENCHRWRLHRRQQLCFATATVAATNGQAQAAPPLGNLLLPCLFPSCFALASICM